jgi:hypothetical protein
MAYEYFIQFPAGWYGTNQTRVRQYLAALPGCTQASPDEYWLKDPAALPQDGAWHFDVRLFTQAEEGLLVEVSAMPDGMRAVLDDLLHWLDRQTEVRVVDDDGEACRW